MNETPEQQTPETCSHNCGIVLELLRRAHRAAKALPQRRIEGHEGNRRCLGQGRRRQNPRHMPSRIGASKSRKARRHYGRRRDRPLHPQGFRRQVPLSADANGLNPGETESGIKMISTNLMLPQEDMAVAWRRVVSGIISQFFNEVNWGELDYLLIDMPPGTSDVLADCFPTNSP